MVAKVNTGKDILGILNYNENKVTEGKAKCIHENLYGQEVSTLTFNDKRKVLETLVNRNRRATTKSVHISLNFHPDEKLTRDTLTDIASSYMDKIGFGNQPYLVYQHLDAAHPHVHIVTTNIQKNGKRIILYNIGRNQSETARKEIEKSFNLIRAEGRKHDQHEILKPINLQKVMYGKSETKQSISNIVRSITHSYKFTSLPELNAILNQYNIKADRGTENSQMRKKNGLLYRVIDKNGKALGIPIKASSIYGKPTLPWLEKQFKLNEALRTPHKDRLKKCLDDILSKKHRIPKTDFVESLNRQSIKVVFRENKDGLVYGMTFIDNKTKVVFNGSDLGKSYGAKAIINKLQAPGPLASTDVTRQKSEPGLSSEINVGFNDVLNDLVSANINDNLSPEAAMKIHKKQKRRGRSR